MTTLDPSTVQIGEIAEVDLREAFVHESATFTPWLAKPENLQRLGDVVGLRLDTLSVEASTGTFRTDIIARNEEDDSLVIIENQFSRSDHDHLGKALTYLATKAPEGARCVIWIAERFADEHRAVLDWLNDSTDAEIRFFGITPKLLRVSGGMPGLRFEVVVAPNEAIKATKREGFQISDYVKEKRRAYWPIFTEVLRADPDCANVVLRHGGGLGHIHVFPTVAYKESQLQPYVLAFLNLSEEQQDYARVYFRPCENNTDEDRERTERVCSLASDALSDAGLAGHVEAGMTDESSMRETARDHLAIVKCWMRALTDVFGPELQSGSSSMP